MADQISDITKILNEYKDLCYETLAQSLDTAGKEAVKELKVTSPKRKKGKTAGKYAKSWKVKKVTKKNGVYEVIVHNTQYQLTHLLEYGHALVIGGRNVGFVKAYPHIKQAEENAIQKVETELKIKL